MRHYADLGLEIQVDSVTKRILSYPEKCRSALLDVTVIKPYDLCHKNRTINTLRPYQVRQLLTYLEKQRRHKQKCFHYQKHNSPSTILKIRRHDDPFCGNYSGSYNKRFNHENKKLPTYNREPRISSNTPVNNLQYQNYSTFGKSVEPLFCEIRKSLKNVETRITNMQDINLIISETTVASTTEGYICSNRRHRKSVSYPTSRHDLKNHQSYQMLTNERPDFNRFLNKQFDKRGGDSKRKCKCDTCNVMDLIAESQHHPLMNELRSSPPPSIRNSETRRAYTKPKMPAMCEESTASDNMFYLFQLSKRVQELEERLAMHEERSISKDYFRRIIQKLVQNFTPKPKSKNVSSLSVCMEDVTFKTPGYDPHKTFNCYQTHLSPECKSPRNQPNQENIWKWGEEVLKPGIDLKNRIVVLVSEILSKFTVADRSNEVKKDFVDKKQVNVSYMNPKLSNAYNQAKLNERTDSLLESTSSEGKQEFVKIISKARTTQKEILWNNIWNQAKLNGQNKNDKIIIKIPTSDKSGKLYEIELTIKEVEEVLLKHRDV